VSLLAKTANEAVITAAPTTSQQIYMKNAKNSPNITTTGPTHAHPIFLSKSHIARKNWRTFAQLKG
jgi:hypothetical protein